MDYPVQVRALRRIGWCASRSKCGPTGCIGPRWCVGARGSRGRSVGRAARRIRTRWRICWPAATGFVAPHKRPIAIERHMIPISEGGLGRIKRVVTRLIVVRPVGLGKAGLNFTALAARGNRTSSSVEGLLVESGTRGSEILSVLHLLHSP